MRKAMKSYSLLSYILKPSHLLTQGFNKNRAAREKLFKQMCNFGARAELSEGVLVVIYYLDVETTKYQYFLLNPTPLECIAGYRMESAVVGRALNRLPRRRLNFIDYSISSYCYILNSLKRL